MEIFNCENGKGLNEDHLNRIVSELQAGRLIVYPTETIYGLGADPFDETAVKRCYMAKRRPFDMALSVAVSNIKMMENIAVVNDKARKLAKKFMPGPLTLVLPKKPIVPDILTASTSEVGIRIPDHPVALKIIDSFGPIISTSANLHSHPNPASIDQSRKDLGATVGVYVDCGPSRIGKPSTILEINGDELNIFRPGVISKEDIEVALRE